MEKILSSKVLYSGRRFTVKELVIELAPEKVVTWEVVDKAGDSVAMVPIDADRNVYLVEEYFGATNERTLCLPKGMVDPGETPAEAALRELQEEIGMKGRLQQLVVMSVSPGYLTQRTTVFLATDLEPSRLSGDEEHSLKVVRLPLTETIDMMQRGAITEARTIGGISLARAVLGI